MRQTNTILRNKITNRAMASLLTLALITSLLSGMGCICPQTAQAAVTLHNPIYDADTDTATWDCVWFGNYWQSDTNGDGVADQNDVKEPIKWRVLSVDGDDVFLLADKNLDCKRYNTSYTNVTWETCTLRSWLNGYGSGDNAYGTDYTSDNFIDNAFSATEQAAIKTTVVVNEDNPYYGTEGGNNTTDKVYLLSIAEASNPAYGFDSEYNEASDTRVAKNTAYVARYGGMRAVGEADWWWLRSPSYYGYYCDTAATVDFYGDGYDSGNFVTNGSVAIRPALHLTLSSSTLLSYAGTVSSDGTENEQGGGSVSGGTAKPSTPTSAPEQKTLSIMEEADITKGRETTITAVLRADSEEELNRLKSSVRVVSEDANTIEVAGFQIVDEISLLGETTSAKIQITLLGKQVGDGVITVTSDKDGVAHCQVTVLSETGKKPIPVDSGSADDVVDAIDFHLSDYLSDIKIEDVTVSGPELDVFGNKFHLFEIEMGTEINLYNLRTEVSVDTDKKLLKVLLGVDTSGKAGIDGTDGNRMNNAAWSKEYNEFKNLYKQMTGRDAKGSGANGSYWNQFQKLRGQMNAFQCKLMVEASMQASGYLEWSYETGELQFSEGGIMEAASLGVELRKNIPQIPLAYVLLKLSADEKGTIVCKATPEGITTDFSLAPSLTTGIGIGMGKTDGKWKTYVEGGMEATLGAVIQNTDPKFSVNLSGNLHLTAYAIGQQLLNATYNYPEVQLYPWELGTAKQVPLTTGDTFAAYAQASPLERDYRTKSAKTLGGDAFLLEQTNLFPYADTRLVTLSDGRLMLIYIGDTFEKSDSNRTSLCYRICDGGVWSKETTIAEDGCYFDGLAVYQQDGLICITYQKANKAFTEDTPMEEMLAAMDVYMVATDGKDFTDPIRLNRDSNMVMEAGQVLYFEENKVSVAWLENSCNDIFLNSGTNSLHYRSFQGQTDTPELVLESTEEVIEEIQIGSLNGKECLVYSMYDNGKKKIYSYVDGKKTQILTDASEAGEFTFFEDALYYLDEGQLCQYNGTSSVRETGMTGLNSFRILRNKDSLVVLTNAVTGNGSEIYMAEKKLGIWSGFVPYTNQKGFIRSWDATVQDGNVLVSMNRLEYDSVQDKYTDASLIVTGESSYYDICADYVVYNEEQVAPSADLDVEVGYTNCGKNNISSVSLLLKDETGNTLGTAIVPETLASGESAAKTVSITLPDAFVSGKIIAQVSIAETDAKPGNNMVENELSYADIALQNVVLTDTGDNVTVTAIVENKGLEDMNQVKTAVYAGTMQGETLAEKSLIQLKAGARQSYTFILPKKDLPESENGFYGFCLYTESETAEKNYANNEEKLIYKMKNNQGSATPSPVPSGKPGVNPTKKPIVSPTEKPGTSVPAGGQNVTPSPLHTGQTYTASSGKLTLVVTATGSTPKIQIKKVANAKLKKIKIPNTLKINGVTCKVTSIAPKAFAGCKKLKRIVIGKYVTSIGKKAFWKCKSLRRVTVKSKVLKKVGKNAFKGTSKKLKVILPKSLSKVKKKKYQKMFKGKGNKKLRVK